LHALKQAPQNLVPNIVTLRQNGIKKLYHFTDAANIASIDHRGLMSASNLIENAIESKMNSNDVSCLSGLAQFRQAVLLREQSNDACGPQ
jgi:hypothetical protein